MALITLTDAAERLGLKRGTIYMALYKGHLTRSGKKVGSEILIDSGQLKKYRKDHPARAKSKK
jgi:excisionase family DNA binding protein